MLSLLLPTPLPDLLQLVPQARSSFNFLAICIPSLYFSFPSGEVAQLCKQEAPRPQYPHEKPGVAAHIYKPALRMTETGGPLGLAGH